MDGLIRLRGNIDGDLNTFSYDSMILGVFNPGDGEPVGIEEPKRAQSEACMNARSVLVWHEGEEIAHFVGEVSVIREEHSLLYENLWYEWDE